MALLGIVTRTSTGRTAASRLPEEIEEIWEQVQDGTPIQIGS
jgi:hypothetical protein